MKVHYLDMCFGSIFQVSSQQQQEFRQLVIGAVLATDMSVPHSTPDTLPACVDQCIPLISRVIRLAGSDNSQSMCTGRYTLRH